MGMSNLHNKHIYADENPHVTMVVHYKCNFKINVWARFTDILPLCLNGLNYLKHLVNFPNLLDKT